MDIRVVCKADDLILRVRDDCVPFDPEERSRIVDPEDIEMLSDMIIAAVNESIKKASEDKEETMQKISGQMNLPGLF